MKFISKRELAERAKLLPETVDSLISLGVLKVEVQDGIEMITLESVEQVFPGDLNIEVSVERSSTCDEKKESDPDESRFCDAGFGTAGNKSPSKSSIEKSNNSAFAESVSALQSSWSEGESVEQVLSSEVSTGPHGGVVEETVTQSAVEIVNDEVSVSDQSRVISILVERVNSLSQENRWLKSQIEAQRRELEMAHGLVSKQIDLIEKFATAPRFPLLSRIFQALGLEAEKPHRHEAGK